MDTKTKIIKILPYWLAGVLILCSVVTASFILNPNSSSAQAFDADPQVLGESTTVVNPIRGQVTAAPEHIAQINEPDTSDIKAQSFLVFDLATGQTLLEKNPDQKLAIASLTKLMTGLVAYDNSNLNSSFTITGNDVLNVSPDLSFKIGDSVQAQDVFNAMIIGSCNDAALSLANYTAAQTGKNFVYLMNQEAAELGMANTSYANPLGFDSKSNYSTANDLKLLISATQQLSAFTNLGRRTGYEFTGDSEKTYYTIATNTLLKTHSDIQAIKTGYTAEANGAMATKVDFNGHQIVILVLDSGDREGDTLKLKNDISQSFNWN